MLIHVKIEPLKFFCDAEIEPSASHTLASYSTTKLYLFPAQNCLFQSVPLICVCFAYCTPKASVSLP